MGGLNDIKAEGLKTELDCSVLLESVRINPLNPVEKPPIILEVHNAEKIAPVATLGNFSLLIGKAKSKKTFLMVALIATCVNSEEPQPNEPCY